MIEALKRKGMNQSEIARALGVTRQWVSLCKRQTSNYSKTPRERAMEKFPWKTTKDTSNGNQFDRKLRDHAEFMETGGEGMSDVKLTRLEGFYKKLLKDNLVVEYDPDIPPSKGSWTGGYTYRPREESDGDLIIRVNDGVIIDQETLETTWTWPPKWPERKKKKK